MDWTSELQIELNKIFTILMNTLDLKSYPLLH